MFKPIPIFVLLTGCLAAEIALAETAQINRTVAVKPGESYAGLLARSSKLAGETIERRFQNSGSDRVNLLVNAENLGEIAPLLSVSVSRQQWRSNPQIDRWANVFPFSKDLLGFGGSRPASAPTPPAPTVTPSPATPPAPTVTPSPTTPPTAAKKPLTPIPVPLEMIPSDTSGPPPLPGGERLRPPSQNQGESPQF